jgi:hypothetical protein
MTIGVTWWGQEGVNAPQIFFSIQEYFFTRRETNKNSNIF